MKTAIYPGTFDPITCGHIDILKKATSIFDKVILAVAENTAKHTSLFTLDERVFLCKESTKDISGVEVRKFEGLVVDFAKELNSTVMIRGLRAVSDFEYELSLALMNKKLNSQIDTMFFVPDAKYLYLSSTIVKQVVKLGGDIHDLIPSVVEKTLKEKK